MKKMTLSTLIIYLRFCIITFVLALVALILFSFSTAERIDSLFTQLGIAKADADRKISTSIIGGYVNVYGLTNLKSIVSADRKDICLDLLSYTKNYVNSPSFKSDYSKLREGAKPVLQPVQSPAEVKEALVDSYKKTISDLEEALKTAGPELKAIFQQALTDNKQALKDAEDPTNPLITNYRDSYPSLLSDAKKTFESSLTTWEAEYPANHLLFVKKRLAQFITETEAVNFDAELVERNGKRIFANHEYESKNHYWKMAFRAGKDVVQASRQFVAAWMQEIK